MSHTRIVFAHLFVLLFCLLVLPHNSEAASRIYKSVDENGNIVFTDVPPADAKQSGDVKEVRLGTGNSFASEDAAVESPEPDAPPAGMPKEEVRYTSAEILSPRNDEALRSNSGSVPVQVSVSPNLQPGHRLRLLLDNQPQDFSGNGTVLAGVSRGTHTLALEVVDAGGRILFSGDTSTFHLQRAAAGG